MLPKTLITWCVLFVCLFVNWAGVENIPIKSRNIYYLKQETIKTVKMFCVKFIKVIMSIQRHPEYISYLKLHTVVCYFGTIKFIYIDGLN